MYDACHGIIKEFGTHEVTADELLSRRIDHRVPIPFKTRSELQQIAEKDHQDGLYRGDLMPEIDLKVLHYFLTQLCLQRYPHLVNCFDETSLIMLGLLVDQWVEEYFLSFEVEESSSEEESDSDNDSYGDGDSGSDSENEQNHSGLKRKRWDDQTDIFKQIIGKGPAESVAKFTNYRDFPADI